MPMRITDDRYFTAGTDNAILNEVQLYEPEMYEQSYPFIESTMPAKFSVNLYDEIIEFTTKAPPQFEIVIEEVIDLACYYYCDWDSVVAVTDEFLHIEALERARRSLTLANYDVKAAEEILQDMIVMLSDALKRVIGIIVGVLSRANAPAVVDYGSCYRLTGIDPYGNAYFELKNPSVVFATLEGDELRQQCTPVSG